MSDLTTLADVEAWLKLKAGNSDEALLTRLITAASGFVEAWCDRTFLSTSYTENRDGDGGRRLPMRNKPLTAVTSLSIGTQTIPAGDANMTPGYFFNDSSISLNGYCFHRGLGNVSITYTAGYATVPFEVAQATIELIALRYKERDRVGLSSETVAAQTTAFMVRDMPPSVATLLQSYKNVVPA